MYKTSQKIKSQELNITCRYQSVSKASTYKCLGLTLDQILNLRDHLTKTYKKSTGRLNLLRRLQPQITVKAAITIYQSMHIPLYTYCLIVTCRTSITYKYKVNPLQNRANEILFRNQPSKKRLPLFEHLMKTSCGIKIVT